MVIKLAEKGIYHSDIKDRNVVVKSGLLNDAKIFLIDLGGCSFDPFILDTYTKN
jgi:hypothetical protein